MVLQDAAGSLNPRQTVYESVAEGIRLHAGGAADEQGRTEADLVAAALAEAGLRPPERLFLRYPHELSGGQKQRVLIAGALALAPASCCSPTSRCRRSTPRSAARSSPCCSSCARSSGVGIVVVTHDLGLAWNIADRIAVMYLGRVVEFGTTEEVLESPRHPYTRALLSRRTRDRAARAGRADRRDPGPDPDPRRLPVPPALPAARGRLGRRPPGVEDACLDDAAGRAARRRRAPGGLPPRRGAHGRSSSQAWSRQPRAAGEVGYATDSRVSSGGWP